MANKILESHLFSEQQSKLRNKDKFERNESSSQQQITYVYKS